MAGIIKMTDGKGGIVDQANYKSKWDIEQQKSKWKYRYGKQYKDEYLIDEPDKIKDDYKKPKPKGSLFTRTRKNERR